MIRTPRAFAIFSRCFSSLCVGCSTAKLAGTGGQLRLLALGEVARLRAWGRILSVGARIIDT